MRGTSSKSWQQFRPKLKMDSSRKQNQLGTVKAIQKTRDCPFLVLLGIKSRKKDLACNRSFRCLRLCGTRGAVRQRFARPSPLWHRQGRTRSPESGDEQGRSSPDLVLGCSGAVFCSRACLQKAGTMALSTNSNWPTPATPRRLQSLKDWSEGSGTCAHARSSCEGSKQPSAVTFFHSPVSVFMSRRTFKIIQD